MKSQESAVTANILREKGNQLENVKNLDPVDKGEY